VKKYQSIKVVEAFQIDQIEGTRLYDEDGGFVDVSHEWIAKHEPKAGGYFVRYKDGYESWSPAGAFEEGYICMEPPVFEDTRNDMDNVGILGNMAPGFIGVDPGAPEGDQSAVATIINGDPVAETVVDPDLLTDPA